MPDAGFGTPPGPQLSNATPVATPTAGPGTSLLAARADHDHGVTNTGAFTVAPSTPTRTLNTPFTPNASKPTWCSYSINLSVTNPLLAGSSTATIILYSDANTTPTTERARATNASSVALTVTVQITQPQTCQISYICPAGHKMLLTSSTSGTAAVSIASQVEVALG